MNLIYRARLSITKNIKRTTTLFFLVLFLSTFLSMGASIRNAIYQTESNLRFQLTPVATIEWDHRSEGVLEEGKPRFEFLITDVITEVGSLPYVLDYDIRSESSLNSRELVWGAPPVIDNGLTEEMIEYIDQNRFSYSYRDFGAKIDNFPVIGIHNPIPVELQVGLITMESGRFMTQEELDNGAPVAVISNFFAETNHLQLGSTVVLENSVHDHMAMQELEYLFLYLDDYLIAEQLIELEIIGIFNLEKSFVRPLSSGEFKERAKGLMGAETQFLHQFYIPHRLNEELARFRLAYESVDWLDLTEDAPIVIQPTFLLNDPREVSAFAEAAAPILPEGWHVYDTSGIFSSIINSMDEMLWIAQLIFWGGVFATITILSLLIMLFLRERKHEIGIYRALGEKKGKIISQMVLEVLSISILAMSIALFLGNSLSSHISQRMLKQEIIRQEQNSAHEKAHAGHGTPEVLQIFEPTPMSIEEMMAYYDISLDKATVIGFFGVGIGTVLASTIIPIFYLVRLDPKKILM